MISHPRSLPIGQEMKLIAAVREHLLKKSLVSFNQTFQWFLPSFAGSDEREWAR